MRIGLNSDMGEGFGPYQVGDDEALMPVISSANIACGFHAGDSDIMAARVRQAAALGLDIGSHPGLADRQGFGRRVIPMAPQQLIQQMLYQHGALQAIAAAQGQRLTHLSFHAAMGNMVDADEALALQAMQALQRLDPGLRVYGMPGTRVLQAAQRAGLRPVGIFLADRAYDGQGQLVSRQRPGAVLTDAAAVAQRVSQLLDDGSVTTTDGTRLPVRAQAILVHGDTPGAVALARAVRQTIERGGGQVVPPSQLDD